MLTYPGGGQMPLDDIGHVLRRDAGVPDIVGEDEDYRSLVVAARTGVAQHCGRRQAAPLDLSAEGLEELAATLGTAAALPRRRAHEDLSKPRHKTNSMARAG
jgi:hypothetical protein